MKYIFCGNSKEKAISKINLRSGDIFYHVPLTQIKSISNKITIHQNYDAGVCASQNIVQNLPDISKLGVPIWFGVGPQTAKDMHRIWKIPEIHVPDVYNALSVADLLVKYIPSGNVLWLGAKGGVMLGVEKLISLGFQVTLHQPYETLPLSIQESAYIWQKQEISLEFFLNQQSIWIFTSPLIAKSYLDQNLNRVSHLLCCLGSTTASIFLNKGLNPYHIAKLATLESLFMGINRRLNSSDIVN